MIIAVVGPTAVGKTRLSVELAKKYNGVIINADSTQVYKGMNIGTAKVTPEEKEGVLHLLFDIVDITTNYTVFDYQRDVRELLEKYKDRNIILVGGTGLYLKAALYNYEFLSSETINNYEDKTNAELYQLALKKDPEMKIHENNRKRLVRFLNREVTKEAECYPLYDALIVGLTTDRKRLYERINERTEEMFQAGLVEEVKSLYKDDISSKALDTAIGYKEVIQYLKGEITLEEAKELVKKNCRHYAKRQYTWFNHQMPVTWFNVNFEDFSKTIDDVCQFLDNKNL